MIKIKLYYSIVAILFLFPVSVTKEMPFYLFPPTRSMVQRCKFSGEPICQILEEQTGERVGSFGSSGQGPGEFVAAEFIGKTEGDDTLYFVNLPSTVLLYAREEKSADSPMVNW